MLIDTPAKIAILGAGPVGLEAALYARYLGYEVEVFEQSHVGESLRGWGHARMITPFGMNRSSLGLAALAAQDPSWQPPGDDDLLTGCEYIERYLRPLALSDLLADCVHEKTRVIAVTRHAAHKGDSTPDDERGQGLFRLLVQDAAGEERDTTANIVLDCSGAAGSGGGLGRGGAPAEGESHASERIVYGQPDVLGADRDRYAGQHTLVVGDSLAAAATIVALSQLAREALDTHATWITRQPLPSGEGDPLPKRARLWKLAAATASDEDRHIDHWPDCVVESLSWDASEERFAVECEGQEETAWFDALVAPASARPDFSAQCELRLALDPVSEAPLGLAARLAETAIDSLAAPAFVAEDFLTPEPNYYVLGAKSYGRNERFLIAHGLAQIVALFSGIAGRETLDLYATALPSSGE